MPKYIRVQALNLPLVSPDGQGANMEGYITLDDSGVEVSDVTVMDFTPLDNNNGVASVAVTTIVEVEDDEDANEDHS